MLMRVAIIADIHGNADALHAVLTDIRQQGVSRIIVNGDVVNRGPDSVQVLSELLARDDVEFTLGNHDDLLRLWQQRSNILPADWFDDPFWGATVWSTEQMAKANLLDVPAAWPMTLALQETGLPNVLIAHGTADHYRESLSEKTLPERIEELAQQGKWGVLVGSHIHRPVDTKVAGVQVLNTGATGSPANGDPRAQYIILTATATGWHSKLRLVPYDRTGVLQRFKQSGLLSTGLSAEIFRDELITSRSLYTPFWLWTEEQLQPRNQESWQIFLKQHQV